MPGKLSSAARKLLSGSVLRLCYLVAAAASSFFLMPLIVHHLGDRLYGFWALVGTFIGYYGLLDFGFSSAVTQYMSIAIGNKDPRECGSVFNAAFRIQSFLGCVALFVTALLAVAAPWFCSTHEDAVTFTKVIAILGASMAISFPPKAYSGILDAQLRFDISSALAIVGVLLRTGLSAFAVIEGGGLLALAWMSLLGNLPVIALQVFFAKREAPWATVDRSPLDRAMAKSFFSYSIYTFLTVLADMLRFQVDALVIAGMIGLVAVTHYRVASVFARYYTDIISCITGVLQPVLGRLHAAKDRRSLETVFFFATRVSLASSVLIGTGLICWGSPFITRWMGPKYHDAYWPLVILSLSVLLDVGQNPSISLLYATFKHRFYTYMNCAEGVLNLVFSLVLVRSFGVLGVALGTLIAAFLIRALVQPYAVCKVSGIDFKHYLTFVVGSLLRCIGLLGVAIVASLWGLKPSYGWLVASAGCATIIYAIGAWRFVFSPSERGQLRSLINRKQSVDPELSPAEAMIR